MLAKRSKTSLQNLVVSVTHRRHPGNETCAGGRHEEDRHHAEHDRCGPQAPHAEEVAQDAQCHPHGPGGNIVARAQKREKDAARTHKETYNAADPAEKQLQRSLAPLTLADVLTHVPLPICSLPEFPFTGPSSLLPCMPGSGSRRP